MEEKYFARITSRNAAAMDMFYEKPIFGWGISSEGFAAHDLHVGNQSILLSGGIIGMAIILYILYFVAKKTVLLKNISQKSGQSSKYLLLIIIFLLGLIIIHSSSSMMFGFMTFFYPLHFNKVIFLSIFFAIINVLLVEEYKTIKIANEARNNSN